MSRQPNDGDAVYPTKRFEVRSGWYLEVLPLALARGRIIHTDGVVIDEFW